MTQYKHIDDDVRQHAKEYVDAQMATMNSAGVARKLAPEEYYDLVYRCALPCQQIRDMKKQAERRKAKAK